MEMKHEDDFREGSSVCKSCKRRADLKSIGSSDIGAIELSNIVREMAIQMKMQDRINKLEKERHNVQSHDKPTKRVIPDYVKQIRRSIHRAAFFKKDTVYSVCKYLV